MLLLPVTVTFANRHILAADVSVTNASNNIWRTSWVNTYSL
jgi:hypothetical protein